MSDEVQRKVDVDWLLSIYGALLTDKQRDENGFSGPSGRPGPRHDCMEPVPRSYTLHTKLGK